MVMYYNILDLNAFNVFKIPLLFVQKEISYSNAVTEITTSANFKFWPGLQHSTKIIPSIVCNIRELLQYCFISLISLRLCGSTLDKVDIGGYNFKQMMIGNFCPKNTIAAKSLDKNICVK